MVEPPRPAQIGKWLVDGLFGERLTGDDLARRLATRPPRWARNTQLSLYLLILVTLAAGHLGLTYGLPFVGPWLVRNGALIAPGCLAIIIALELFYRRRAAPSRKP